MALALARHNIKVNAIGPGSIMTDVLQAVAADKAAMDRSVTLGPSDSCLPQPACLCYPVVPENDRSVA